ncbi:MAG: sulfatase [Chloroflexi bacterium]|nr:sulfatase [Chloroflexota bacterium]
MNIIWITADTFRQDHMGAYGHKTIRTPTLDALAAKGTRFESHYAGGFPTMPTRADHATGRWTMSYMGWEPLPEDEVTLAQILSENGYHTAAAVDTPFYIRGGMNYDRGFQTFFFHPGQEGSPTRVQQVGNHESRDLRDRWRLESDHNAPQTFINAMNWLEGHYKEDFFLYIDTWDPHEPWEAPPYYSELYWPDFDGEIIQPIYGHWQDEPGFSAERVRKANATYCGEITMVDTWIGYFLKRVENMGLMENTAIVFTSDHGFYFGEHGGKFGKMTFDTRDGGGLYKFGDDDARWAHSPLYEELVRIPLLVYVPGVDPSVYSGKTSVVDVMPTVLDVAGVGVPDTVHGTSLLPRMRDGDAPGREFVVSTIPFANPGEEVRSVDSIRRHLVNSQVTTITAGDWSLLYSMDEGMSELYNIANDPGQQDNIISDNLEVAKEVHQYLLKFMRETGVSDHLLKPRQEFRL